MRNIKKKAVVIRSIQDFEKLFYPKSKSPKSLAEIADPELLGTKLAQRSIRKVRYLLIKSNQG